jgi:hypothetical protein
MKTKPTAIFLLLVHLLNVEIVPKNGELAIESQGTTRLYLDIWSWAVRNIACNTKSSIRSQGKFF